MDLMLDLWNQSGGGSQSWLHQPIPVIPLRNAIHSSMPVGMNFTAARFNSGLALRYCGNMDDDEWCLGNEECLDLEVVSFTTKEKYVVLSFAFYSAQWDLFCCAEAIRSEWHSASDTDGLFHITPFLSVVYLVALHADRGDMMMREACLFREYKW